MKTCRRCKHRKKETDFNRDRSRPDGRHPYCKTCKGKEYRVNRVDVLRAKKEDRNADPEKYRERDRRRSASLAAKQYLKWYRRQNREHRREYNNEWRKNRYNSHPDYRLACVLRSRLTVAFNGGNGTKTLCALDLLGCTLSQLRAHLSSLFRPGMSWENHGPVWHIDHIKPCAKFDLTDPNQQRCCFHYTNLQPLFALENLKKNATYPNV